MPISYAQYFNLLTSYLKPYWPRVLLLALLLLGGAGLQLVTPQIIRNFIDTSQAGGPLETLVAAALLFLGLSLGAHLTSCASGYIGTDVGYRATDRLRIDLVRHCLGLDLTFHHRHTPGEMISRIDSDVGLLNDLLSQFALRLLSSALLLVGVLIMLGREDWRVGGAAAVLSLVAMWVYHRFRETNGSNWAAVQRTYATFYSFMEERLAGIEDIRANGIGDNALRQQSLLRAENLRWRRRAHMIDHIIMLATRLPLQVAAIGAYAVGAYLFLQDAVTIGTVYLFIHYAGMREAPLGGLSRDMGQLRQVSAGLRRINELYQTRSRLAESTQGPSGGQVAPGKGRVVFDHVAFSYGDGPKVLNDISFELAPGQRLGLLGRTGSGKSTLIRLLFRFYDPVEGVIRFDNQPLPDWPLATLRRQIGLVTQEVQLFQATVRDNLTFFDRGVDDAQIMAVIDELGLDAWLERLPDGLDTALASGGSGLSAGEAQLLALTRVFLKAPALVVLDEASSRLDPATEDLLGRALERLLAGRSAIVIAHRLRTVQQVDQILVLQQGRVLEHGARKTLAEDPNSHFHRLLKTGLEEVLA